MVAQRDNGELLESTQALSTLLAPRWRWANVLPAPGGVHAGSTPWAAQGLGGFGFPARVGIYGLSTLVAPGVHAAGIAVAGRKRGDA